MSISAADHAYMEAHKNATMAPDIIVAASLGLVTSIAGVLLRLLARRRTNKRLQADDWLILMSLVMDFVMKVTACVAVAHGFGRHIIFVDDFRMGAILGLVNEELWIFVATPTKISVLCLYNRLFTDRALFRWSLFIGFIVSAYSIAYAIALGFQTIPFRAQWTLEPAWYANMNALIGVVAGLDVLTDIMMISSPIPQILKLNLHKQRKRELIAVFGVGAIVVVFGIVRTVFTSITPVSDVTYNDAKCEIWSLLQPSIGIFSACLPCLRPLLPGRLGSSAAASPPMVSKAVKPRITLDYEMFSQGKDGWRLDEEATKMSHVTQATQGSKTSIRPEKGIRIETNFEITYESTANGSGVTREA